MATIPKQRLAMVFLSAFLLMGLFAWRLQASGLITAMFDSSSPPISPIATPTDTPTSVPTPTLTPEPPPIIIRVEPDHVAGSAPGAVTIRGDHFQKSPAVTIGTTPLTSIRLMNCTEIQADLPAGLAPGAYPIKVCNPDARCDTLPNALTVTGDAPVLTGIVPAQGHGNAPNEVAVSGFNLHPDVTIKIADTALVNHTRISAEEVRGIVPAGLAPGAYDVVASNPGSAGDAVLHGGYTVFDINSDDFFVESADIWTDPATLRQGDVSTVTLGVNVHRQGGTVAQIVEVSFYLGDPAAGGVLLGSETTGPMAPSVGAIEPVFIVWNPGNLVGTLAIYVSVDPAGQIAEINEANNLAQRALLILPASQDTTPPNIVEFGLNNGAQITTDPAIQVAIKATDDSSGVYSMYLAERSYNATANQWLAVQHTGWLSFQGSYTFTLTGPGGARYIEAWVADGAGNVTPVATRRRINYLPPSDIVLAQQVRVFRFTLVGGERFVTTLTTLNAEGDADLYIWGPHPPDQRPLWMSDRAGTEVDILDFVAPASGDYDVEVRGWNVRSEYRLTVAMGGEGRAAARPMASAAVKPLPSRPADASATSLSSRGSVPPALIAPPAKVHLPIVMQRYQAIPLRLPVRIHLPMILRGYAVSQPVTRTIHLPMVLR
jgi:hypothetical protein